ncbi:viroplasmin family protein [Patescibacteria group bacterium]|nr:viroplasmin family protein [Patescibacteria group bacterium]
MSSAKKYYAYFFSTDKQGICDSWIECEKIVSGKNARFRGFSTRSEAEAWLNAGANYELKPKKQRVKTELLPGIYFDAGTGRGDGTEISVTDENGANLLHKVMLKKKINKHGKHLLTKGETNNYGELLACQYALKLALKNLKKGIYPERSRRIFGDSKLVIEYWSKGFIKRNDLPKATVKLADAVAKLRKKFEEAGGQIRHISGDDNPADLGFH